MKKLYISRILKFTALLLTIAVLFVLAQHYLFFFTDYNAERFRNFYKEEPNSLDVVFMGASEVQASYAPGYAYDLYGYTSYLYTQDSNHGQLFEAQVKEILSCQSPELIVVDAYGFLYPGETEEARVRLFAENIPLSLNRIDTILNSTNDHKLSYLLPMIKYHSKWWSNQMLVQNIKYRLAEQDRPSNFKGVVTNTIIYEPPVAEETLEDAGVSETIEISEYLVGFLEFCQGEGLDNIVFINIPHHDTIVDMEDMMLRVKEVEKVITAYGYPFLELQGIAEEIGIDFATDFYDDHHMNTYGQFKMTEYLGGLLMNQYGLTPREQTPENEAHWQQCAVYAREYYELADYYIRKGERVILSTEESFLVELEKLKNLQ